MNWIFVLKWKGPSTNFLFFFSLKTLPYFSSLICWYPQGPLLFSLLPSPLLCPSSKTHWNIVFTSILNSPCCSKICPFPYLRVSSFMGHFHFGCPTEFSDTIIPLKLSPLNFLMKDNHSVIHVGALDVNPDSLFSLNPHINLVIVLSWFYLVHFFFFGQNYDLFPTFQKDTE